MEQKKCTKCNKVKSINEFGQRKIILKDGTEKYTLVSACKSCVSLYSKQHYKNKKKDNYFYVYRFLNSKNETIYVGSSQILRVRINQHFSGGHLPQRCYDETAKIEYIKTNSLALMYIKEIYYINMFKPIYNKEFKNVNDKVFLFSEFKDDTWHCYSKEATVKEDLLINENENSETQNMFKTDNLTSIFYRKRGNNFLVYFEYTIDSKRKQVREGTYKKEKEAKDKVKELKQIYKERNRTKEDKTNSKEKSSILLNSIETTYNVDDIVSIFYRNRRNNFLVYIEIKNNNKTRQIRQCTCKDEDSAREITKLLKQQLLNR